MGTLARKLVVPLVILGVIGSVVFIGWRAAIVHEDGWTGMGYYWSPREEKVPGMGFLMREQGEVIAVVPGTPAEAAGFRARDRVTAVNGIPLAEQNRLRAIADRVRTGDPINYS